MDTPFKVIFRHPDYYRSENPDMEKTDREIIDFVRDELSLYKMSEEDIPEVIENKRLELEFICEDETARLYMDGLDTIPMRYLDIDEHDEAYLSPASTPLYLYNNQKYAPSADNYYPLIPGYYRIKVVVDDRSYYSWLKVQPKQISEEQWKSMRNNVEDTLHGLAQDLIRKNASIGINESLPIPLNILGRLYVIKKDYWKWMNSLKAIEKDPRLRIQKEYNLLPEAKAGIIDQRSIRYRSRHPESRDFVYTPKHTQNFNLPENQWIKKIVRYIAKETNILLEYLEKYKAKVEQEVKREKRFHDDEHIQVRLKTNVLDELTEYERFTRQVRNECFLILKTNWMEEVQSTNTIIIPHVLHLDERYRQLYKLYRMLKTEEFSISLDTNYDYYWKRTDLLYEIWGFLQLIDGLQHESVGFEVVKGWIFDMDPNTKTIHIPFLEGGTAIEFKKENIKLCLVYDEFIPFKKEATTLDKPIFTNGSHNRPDVRMDIYYEEEYIGTIVIDLKYRPLRYIWDNSSLQAVKQTDTMRQLISYRENMNSSFLYRNKIPNQWHRFRTVHEVWAVYPKHEANAQVKSPMDNYQIRLMELTPLEGKETFHQGISEAIEKVILAYQDIFQTN